MSDVLSTIKDVRDAIENGQSTAGYIESQIDAMTSASGPDAEQQIQESMGLIADAVGGIPGGVLQAMLTATMYAGNSDEAKKYQNTFLRYAIDLANSANNYILPEYKRPDGYPEGYPVPEREPIPYPDGDYYKPEDLLESDLREKMDLGGEYLDKLRDVYDALKGDASLAQICAPNWSEYINSEVDRINNRVNSDFKTALNFVQRRDPLALDLDGDGIETVSANSGITFDFDGDGLKTGTGWVKGDDGLLVLDRNGNGSIDTGAELFGVDTVKANGQLATDGFDALRDLDGNADGVFDAQDAQFANVRVWQDLNQDGVAQAGELKSLAEHNITAINLGSTQTSQNSNGNLISAVGSFVRDDGTEGEVNANQSLAANLDLAANPFYREYTDSVELDDAAKALPDMQGSGAVRDLREAAMLDAGLKSVLSQYSQAQTREQQMALLDQLLVEWASSSGYQTWDQRIGNLGSDTMEVSFAYSWELPATDGIGFGSGSSSGELGMPAEDSGPTAAQLAQKQVLERIKILEIFNGQNFFNFSQNTTSTDADADAISSFTLSSGTTSGTKSLGFGVREVILTEEDILINAGQAGLLNQAYDALVQSVYNGLLLQTRLKPYVDSIGLTLAEEGVSLDFAETFALLEQAHGSDPIGATIDLLEFGAAISGPTGWSDAASAHLSIWMPQLTTEQIDELRLKLGGGNKFTFGDGSNNNFISNLLLGESGNDTINGTSGSDVFLGGVGSDTLSGNDGADLLDGGTGNDYLNGGYGSDTYLLTKGAGYDTIYDYDYNAN
ncbi:calcium-binding protein, partial [Pseudomonas sp. SA3-5]